MGNSIQSFKSTIENANKILLVTPHIINTDVCSSLGLVYKMLKEKMQKDVDIASSRSIPTRYHDLLKICGVDVNKIYTEIKPVSYVIRVNDTNDSVEVEWKKKSDNIEVVLTPEKDEIDFSKVSFSKEGGIYDVVIAFNAQRLEDLGRIYTEFEKLYSRFEIISISHQPIEGEYAKISLNDENSSTTSEIVYKMYDDLGYNIDKTEAEIIAHGILGSTYGLHRVSQNKTYKVISELANKYQVDLSNINTKYFYSLSKEGLKLRERLLQNVKFDEARKTIYSVLTNRDFSDIRVSPRDLDGMDYLPFNVCKDYDIAFLSYEENGKSHVLIHSNRKNKDLTGILKKVNGVGDKSYGVASFETDAISAASTTLNAIWGAPTSTVVSQQTNVSTLPKQLNSNTPAIQQTPSQQYNQSNPAPQPSNQTAQVQQQFTQSQPNAAPQQPVPNNTAPDSPFNAATEFAIDESVEPMKVSTSFTGTNTPFDSAL